MSAVFDIKPLPGLVSVCSDNFVPDAYALRLLPESVAREHHCLPLYCSLNTRQLHVCSVAKPTSRQRQRVHFVVKQQSNADAPWRVQWHTATREDIQWGIQYAYASSHELDEVAMLGTTQADVPIVTFDNEQWPVVRWFDALLNDAVHRRASDIHLLAETTRLCIRYRIDGVMVNRVSLPLDLWPILVARIKMLANLDVTEHRRPQDGALQRPIQQRVQPVRVAIMPHLQTEKITLRALCLCTGLAQCRNESHYIRRSRGSHAAWRLPK